MKEMTFTYPAGNWVDHLHLVEKIGLSLGSHGIPDGFQLYARCGRDKREALLDFTDSDEQYVKHEKCPQCFPTEVKL